MKQPITPRKVSFANWGTFFGCLLVYIFAFYLPDFILLATSFENRTDADFALSHVSTPLVDGIYKLVGSLVCPMVTLPFLFAGLLPRRIFRTIILCAPLLVVSALIVHGQITDPHTSKRRFQKRTRILLPRDHVNYLAYHPCGADLWSHPFVGSRDFYSFDVPAESMNLLLETYPVSEDWKHHLLGNDRIRDATPAQFRPLLSNSDIQVSRAEHSGFLITLPGTPHVLIIWWQTPH